MKVSVITTCYNSESTILDAIKSVQNQTYQNIEHVIIDGGSTDNSIEIIKENINENTVFISEKDDGCYDAFNKGIKNASGDLIGFLHSDDIFYSDDIIQKYSEKIKDAPGIYGDLIYVDEKNIEKQIRLWKSRNFEKRNFYLGWMIAHPTLYLRKEIYDKFGGYDLDFPIAADYEFMVRVLFKNDIQCLYLPEIVTKMREGGQSSASIKNRLYSQAECWNAWVKNDISYFPVWTILKPFSKINQWFLKTA